MENESYSKGGKMGVGEMIFEFTKGRRWELELEPEMRSCRHFFSKNVCK
jgi:hypothetical protein